MKLQVVITSQEIRLHTSAKGNEVAFQKAMFERGDGAVFPTELMVDAHRPHLPGTYALAPSSFVPGQFGRIEFRPVLEPLAPVKSAPVAAVK